MNIHFSRESEFSPEYFPRQSYARVEHQEVHATHSGTSLIAFDLIDANWLDGQTDNRFLDRNARPDDIERAWKYWFANGASAGDPPPLDNAPLFRLEVELSDRMASRFEFPQTSDPLGPQEQTWYQIELAGARSDGVPALVYAGLYAAPAPVVIKSAGALPTKASAAFNAMFTLKGLPTIFPGALGAELAASKHLEADFLLVMDVGQGNANALARNVGGKLQPTMYFDLGAGVYRNRHTPPKDLRFCFSEDPRILLSHWDTDHWAGAYAMKINGKYPALKQTWIAPLQTVTSSHLAFACEVLAEGGKFLIYDALGGLSGSYPLPKGRLLKFTRGMGSDRNGSGITVAVENTMLGGTTSWILTGDCDYEYFKSALTTSAPAGLVVPHHGANLLSGSPVPSPSHGYRRLVYSYGIDNAHGSKTPPTRHPTSAGMQAHVTAGWSHASWSTAAPGHPLGADDNRSTCEHLAPQRRDGVVIGWNSGPHPTRFACNGTHCNTPCGQQ